MVMRATVRSSTAGTRKASYWHADAWSHASHTRRPWVSDVFVRCNAGNAEVLVAAVQLAARMAVSNLHKSTLKSFSET